MQQPANFSSARMLLAHGNKTTLKLYESVLRSYGVKRVEAVMDVREAVQSVQAGMVDLAILDQSIGIHETQQVIGHIRQGKTRTEKAIPILLTYGHSSKRDVLGLRDSGANMVMTLPFSIQSFYERLAWLALKPRPFVTADKYIGPCRRLLDDPLLAKQARRDSDRAKDLRRVRR